MGWTEAPGAPEVVFHYSEDPSIARFAPHVPRSTPVDAPAVWAIDADRAPLYWFPRDCPRATVWANHDEQRTRLHAIFNTTADRVQVAPCEWQDRMSTVALYEYRFDAVGFAPWDDAEGQWISRVEQLPIGVAECGDLIERQRSHAIDLRFVEDLAVWRETIVASGLPFSIVRYRSES